MPDIAPTATPPETPRKTFGGLTMLAIVGGWLLLLAVWMGWHLNSQVKEIRTFTETSPQPLAPVSPDAETQAALQNRLQAFAAAMDANQKAVLELSVADLNYLLAAQEPVSRLKDIARVEEITDVIRFKVALRLNGMPFADEQLYLNGFITARPELRKDTGLILLTRTIEVPGKTLTPGFTKTYLDANHLDGLLLDELRKDARLKTLLTKITAIRCEAGKVMLEYLP